MAAAFANFAGHASPAPLASQTAAPAAGADEFPRAWFWRTGRAASAHPMMTGKAPPPLEVVRWEGDAKLIEQVVGISGDADPWKRLLGKVVVVDFWATWCGPCLRAIPENVAMVKEYADDGLVFLGIHDASRGSETMSAVARANKINYVLAVDDGGKSARHWNVSFWPTYAVVDRSGTLRAVGLQPKHVRTVVEKLLAEPAPAGVESGVARTSPDAAAKPDAAGDNSTSPKSAPDEKSAPAPAGDAATPSGRPIAAKPPSSPKRLPDRMLEGKAARRAALAKFDSCPEAPPLRGAIDWVDPSGVLAALVRKADGASPASDAGASKPSEFTLADLRGKIVVLDFWATWCGPCISSIPKNNDLARRYADRGVVMIGVCHPERGSQMRATAEKHGIAYPICLDVNGSVIADYVVDSYPDYYIIDRDGRLRGADLNAATLPEAIESLLAEDARETTSGEGAVAKPAAPAVP